MALEHDSALTDQTRSNRRRNIHKRLQRVCPGTTCFLGCLQDDAARLVSDEQEMAVLLAGYWGEVFAARGVGGALLEEWIGMQLGDPRASGPWEVQQTHVDHALAYSNDSSPGP